MLDDYKGGPGEYEGFDLKESCRKLIQARFIVAAEDGGCCKCSLNSVQ